MKHRLEKELGEFIDLMDKEYFDVSEQDRDSIARMIIIKEFLDLKADPSSLPIYVEYLSSRVEHFKMIENYENKKTNKFLLVFTIVSIVYIFIL
jgi:hypothetical protein